MSSKQTKHSPHHHHQLLGASHYPIVFMNLFSSIKSVSHSAVTKTASGRTRSSIVWLVFGTVLSSQFAVCISQAQPWLSPGSVLFHTFLPDPCTPFQLNCGLCTLPFPPTNPPPPTCAPHLPDYIDTLYRCVLCRKPGGPAVYHGTSSCAVVIVCCVLILWCVVCRKHVQHPGPAVDHGLPPLQPPHGVCASHQHHADQVWSLR